MEEQPNHEEGVRIIGADEAAEVMERGDVAPRRSDDELRYGDRPPAPPAGPRPALRFPLDASADPTRIERPPVEPAPDPVTGPVELPHWSEPPTGEVPAVLIGDDKPLLAEDDDDLEAWSSFATSTPRWRDADDDWEDDGFVETLAGGDEERLGALADQDQQLQHHEYFGFDDLEERVEERTGDLGPAAIDDDGPRWEVGDDDWNAAEQGEVGTVAADDAWAGEDAWEDDAIDGRTAVAVGAAGAAVHGHDDVPEGEYDDAEYAEGEYADGEYEDAGHDGYDGYDDGYDDGGPHGPAGGSGGRNIPQAAGAAAVLIGVYAVCNAIGTGALSLLIAVILGLCSVEYFGVLRKVGWASATPIGIVAAAALPLAVGWRGGIAWPLIGAIVVVATFVWFLVGAGGEDPHVIEGTGATILGVAWIGGLGASAAAIAHLPHGRQLLFVTIAATALSDVAGLFVGQAVGHRPVSAASPNKTVEGLLGGMVASFVTVVVFVGFIHWGPWNSFAAALLLGVAVAVAAPLGDVCQSLLKRDLGVKDMGTLLPGHGGVLDRFDSFLFTLPAVLWLTVAFGGVFFG